MEQSNCCMLCGLYKLNSRTAGKRGIMRCVIYMRCKWCIAHKIDLRPPSHTMYRCSPVRNNNKRKARQALQSAAACGIRDASVQGMGLCAEAVWGLHTRIAKINETHSEQTRKGTSHQCSMLARMQRGWQCTWCDAAVQRGITIVTQMSESNMSGVARSHVLPTHAIQTTFICLTHAPGTRHGLYALLSSAIRQHVG